MSNVKISELPVATLPLTGAEELPIVQSGVTNKVSTSNVSPAAISKYVPAGSGAVQTTVQAKLRETVSVKDFGAVGNGVADDTAAIQNAQATGKMLWVPKSAAAYYLPNPVTNTSAAYFPEPTLSWTNFTSNGKLEWTRGFFTDSVNGANVWRFKDRVMVGDAADYSGNRLGTNGYGNSWVTDKGASYLVKNATMAVAAPELDELNGVRYGLVGFSKAMGVGAIGLSDGLNNYARGLYAEGFNYTTGATGGVSAIEAQVGNYTTYFPVINSYNVSGFKSSGVYIAAQSGVGYTVGNNNTPIAPPIYPCGCAIDIGGGEENLSFQKFVTGINIRDGSLYRDPITQNAVAISMAYKHELVWGVNISAPKVAFIRSTVGNAAVPSGIILQDRGVAFVGYEERKILELWDTPANTDVAANYLRIASDVSGEPVALSALGSDTNIDLRFIPKGGGTLRFGFHSVITTETVTGYIVIKDNSGVLRKLAVVS